jgi:thiol-disulfide isomerase/thioredoxin
MQSRIVPILFLTFSAFLASCNLSPPPVVISRAPSSRTEIPPTNLPLPTKENLGDLGWQTDSGTREVMKELRGKVVVLDLWATYCPPCVEEIPHLSQLQNQYGKEKLRVIGLHVGGDDDKENIPSFFARNKITAAYTLAFGDDELTNILSAGDDRIPQTFVFDKSGQLVKRLVGFDPTVKRELDNSIASAVASE